MKERLKLAAICLTAGVLGVPISLVLGAACALLWLPLGIIGAVLAVFGVKGPAVLTSTPPAPEAGQA